MSGSPSWYDSVNPNFLSTPAAPLFTVPGSAIEHNQQLNWFQILSNKLIDKVACGLSVRLTCRQPRRFHDRPISQNLTVTGKVLSEIRSCTADCVSLRYWVQENPAKI